MTRKEEYAKELKESGYFKNYYKKNKEHIREQQKNYKKNLDKMYEGSYLYYFAIDKNDKLLHDKLLYIGSTNNMYNRVANHKSGTTYVSKVIKFLSINNYKIYYLDLKDLDLTRDELYFIEYYLINTYKPILNIRKDNINADRQTELQTLADNLNLENFKEFDLEEFKKQKKLK